MEDEDVDTVFKGMDFGQIGGQFIPNSRLVADERTRELKCF